jgi:hypothetical protein
VARLNYLAQDGPDIGYATMVACGAMSTPTAGQVQAEEARSVPLEEGQGRMPVCMARRPREEYWLP